MKNNHKTFLAIITLAFSFLLSGCQCVKDDSVAIQQIMENSLAGFKSANIAMDLKTDELIVYKKEMDIIKKENGSLYSIDIQKLSDDLYSDSMYEEEYYTGQFSQEETKSILPNALQFNENKLDDYKKENNKITCTISKDNMMSIFGLNIQDINKISNNGIDVELLIDNDKIIKYTYIYDTIDNIKVTIVGEFVY